MLETMYPAAVNSKQTELAEAIDDTQTSFTVLDGSFLPPAPNLLTLGTDESAETVLYTGKTGNEITGVTRGFESGAKSWAGGTKLARFFTAYDHNTFRGNIVDLDQRISNITIPEASLTVKGISQLSDAIDSTDKNKSATPSAVKLAYDEATAAKQLGVEQKANVVAALNSIGVSASTSETWAQLINKVATVIRATGNAVAAQVLAGASFSNSAANGLTGSMPNRSGGSHNLATNTEVWAGDRVFLMAPEGYFDGQSWVFALTPDLSPNNIRVGKNILGINGTLASGPKYASGVVTSANNSLPFVDSYGTGRSYPYITITGLGFRPSRIIIYAKTYASFLMATYNAAILDAVPTTNGTNYNYVSLSGYNFRVAEYSGNGNSSSEAYVNGSSFRLPIVTQGWQYSWEAFGF